MKLFITLLIFCAYCSAEKEYTSHKPEQGIFTLNITGKNPPIFKTLYNESKIHVSYVVDQKCQKEISMLLNVTIIGTKCKGMFRNDRNKLNDCLKKESCEIEHEAWRITSEPATFRCLQNGTVSFKQWERIDVIVQEATSDKPVSLSKRDTDVSEPKVPTTTTTTTAAPTTTTTTTAAPTTTTTITAAPTTTTTTTAAPTTTTTTTAAPTTTTTTTAAPTTTTTITAAPTTTTTTTAAPTTTTTTTTAAPTTTTTTTAAPTTTTTTAAPTTTKKSIPANGFAKVPFMGEFVVIITVVDKTDKSLNLKHPPVRVVVDMESEVGYLSADEYPLLTFYKIMCAVYVLFTVLWLIMSACNCRDLLRIQYWIGGVILLGLIEKVVYVSEYDKVNQLGISNRQMEKLAGFVSCFKRAVSRMLVIVVSLGFGIVKPRLGPKLYQVLGVGFIYFIVALLIQMFEIDVYFNSNTREGWMAEYIPLAVIDFFISYWIFKSLLQTLKTLRIRRNTTKLFLYRHFANTIVFCALVSLAMVIYIIYYHELGCSENFANDWFETACWPLLFSIILLVIMVLWRPTANNQRYAYSPMIDGDDSENEDAEEPMLGNGATESMKIRGMKKSDYVRSDIDMTDVNLQWIDDNIPPTVADAALPVIMDPEDVKRATKYEMSKMD